MKVLSAGVAVVCATLVAFGYMGAWHPAGDSFAVLRVPFVAAFALFVLLAWPRHRAGSVRRRVVGCVTFIGVLAALWPVYFPRIVSPVASDYDFVLYQQNLLFQPRYREPWLQAVDASGADFVTLQEVSAANMLLLTALEADLPTQVFCDFSGVGGVAVLSRFAFVEGSATCAEADGLAAVQLRTPHGLIWLVSIHLHWPWPFGQAEQVDRLATRLDGLDGHVIIGGDFNAVAWSHTVRRLEQASGTQLVGPHQATFHLKGLPIGIDHILTSPAYAQEVRVAPKLGSDHNGVIAFLSRPRAP